MNKLLALVMVAFLLPAQAASQWCQGKVLRVLTYSSGDLTVLPSFRGDWITLCNINMDRAGVPAAVCRAWSSTLQVALVTVKDVVVQYNDAPACDTLATYGAAPIPNYVQIIQ